MLIYKVKSEMMRIGKNKGKTMFYAAPVAQDKITAKQVEDRIINLTALSRADVRSAITALAEIVREEMFAGRAIDLADLGSFKVISTGSAWKAGRTSPPKPSKRHAYSSSHARKCSSRQRWCSAW
ncbi:HU family DNA-binding protein [Prevotella sp. OH937_COT-195]|uniref:HU family DNA-binding protein n=1 Tax=Prevotella sp. OH937_COT-195 TaxID=2491051 RepID=UPI001F185B24|nr:HU family DNA-binding protein [Prevotella sp. OH937_COT-195]